MRSFVRKMTRFTDESFDSRKDNGAGDRCHIGLGHLLDVTQEGYQSRIKSNRVRCAYTRV